MTWTTPLRQALSRRRSPFENLKIALIADDLTRTALGFECRIRNVTDQNYRKLFERWRPDFLLVESCWRGRKDAWRYSIASYPDVPERNNDKLAQVVSYARDVGIHAIFWNREDGVHFDRFIDSAKLFDRVLTVDERMLPAYRMALGPDARIGVMMFAASQTLHRPGRKTPVNRAAFVGSYSNHIHDARRGWQDRMFDAAEPMGLTIFDRNSERKPARYRFPDRPWIELKDAVPHDRTPNIYRRYLVNLNVNTITDSSTAFSRRLVEILACGGFVLTNDTVSVRAHFEGLCMISENADEARSFFERLSRDGLSPQERQMCRAASNYIQRHHSWTQRIPTLLEMAELE